MDFLEGITIMRHPRYKWKFHIPKGKDENNPKITFIKRYKV